MAVPISRAAAERPQSGELPVVIHADELREIKGAVKWAATNQLKLVIAGGRDAWMMADELATNKVPVLFEHTFTQPARSEHGQSKAFRED